MSVLWLIAAFIAGACFGALALALCRVSRSEP